MSSIASSKPDTGAHIIDRIANEIECKSSQVNSAIELLDGGATVPFISRYRKEITGGLSDNQLRTLEDRLSYLRELESRRASIIENIDSLGKLDSTLLKSLQCADTKSELEDLYLPYKQKRKTKGVIAIEAGLEPLAEQLWSDPSQTPIDIAESYVDSEKGVADAKAALTGAKYILMERYAEDAALIAKLRDLLTSTAYLCSSVFEGKEKEGEKFRDYFDYQEQLSKVPSHRALAMFRGRAEGTLALSLKVQESTGEFSVQRCFDVIASHTYFSHNAQPGDDWKKEVVEWTWKIKLATHLESGLFTDLRDKADAEAIRVFADNLKDLLLAAPAGARATLGLDPGFRSGVKVAVVDTTGKLVDHTTIYPHQPQKQWDKAVAKICALCEKHEVQLLAIGNGTASRETDQFASEVIKRCKNKRLLKITVSEAGASVYSASETAEKEFPQLDVTIRGAVSIARRLQDPLAELVKIDPKAIGVGQYQHDVSQLALARSLDATVEDCVNSVGVDLNTCSAALLTRVAGISASIANNIVEHRDQNGAFQQRDELTTVSRLGPKAYEQCAAFLKITNGKNPLDQSAVHPEAYPVVEAIVQHCGVTLNELIGDSQRLRQLDAKAFTNDKFGLPTVRDIIIELDKPGRDPRPEFKTASFAANIEKISDLQPDQILEGQVTNVTNFGAFVDVGVHQDGLVHIASMSNKFIKDPREVVKTGDIVKVKVMSVDVERKRISLSMRLDDSASEQLENSRQPAHPGNNQRHSANNRHGEGKNQSSNRSSRNSAGHAPGRSRANSPGKSAARTSSGSSNNTAVPSALALALQASLGDKGLEK